MSARFDEIYTEAERRRIEASGSGHVDDSDEPGDRAGAIRSRASGAVLAGVMLHLGELLEGRVRPEEPAVVSEDRGEPDDGERPVTVHFDPECPAATRAVIRTGVRRPG